MAVNRSVTYYRCLRFTAWAARQRVGVLVTLEFLIEHFGYDPHKPPRIDSNNRWLCFEQLSPDRWLYLGRNLQAEPGNRTIRSALLGVLPQRAKSIAEVPDLSVLSDLRDFCAEARYRRGLSGSACD